jgi:colicin import membrane protein
LSALNCLARMKRPQYPLEPLADVRERQVDDAVRGLAAAVAQRESAARRARAVEQAAATHAASAEAVKRVEREALERGELTAADLARAHAWELRAQAEHAVLAAEQERARGAEHAASDAEGQSRDELARRRADADVVAKDRARWEAGQRKRADAREEEAMAEAFRPKR